MNNLERIKCFKHGSNEVVFEGIKYDLKANKYKELASIIHTEIELNDCITLKEVEEILLEAIFEDVLYERLTLNELDEILVKKGFYERDRDYKFNFEDKNVVYTVTDEEHQKYLFHFEPIFLSTEEETAESTIVKIKSIGCI
ncbi:MAG: hypothetical protein ACRC5T_04165 [Cetobacterium sp.]